MFHAAVNSKYRISVPKVYQHYSATLQTDRGPRRGMQVTVQRGDGRAPLVAQWDGISLAHKTTIGILDDQPARVWSNRRPELPERLFPASCAARRLALRYPTFGTSRISNPKVGPSGSNGPSGWPRATAKP